MKPAIFNTFDIKKVKDSVSKARTDNPIGIEAEKYFEGDHWQEGEGWVGPRPENISDLATVLALIKEQFVSQNMVSSVIRRHADSLMARCKGSWTFIPADIVTELDGSIKVVNNQIKTIKKVDTGKPKGKPKKSSEPVNEEKTKEEISCEEATKILIKWWKDRDVDEIIRTAVERALYSSTGYIRLYIPQGLLNGNTVPVQEIAEVINLIYVEAPTVGTAARIKDNLTEDIAMVSFRTERSEIDNKDYEYGEIVWCDRSNQITNIKFLSNDPNAGEQLTSVQLRGRLTAHCIKVRPLITRQIIDNQKVVNLSLTMMSRNVVIGGFLERVVTNTQLPGRYVADAEAIGGRRFEPKPLKFGGGITTVLNPIIVEDDEGKKTIANPSITYRDPVPVTTFAESKQIAQNSILQDAEQTHMIVAESGFASGEARIQARANFATSVLRTKPSVDNAVMWLLDTVLQMAATFAGDQDKYKDIKAFCDVKPDTGPLTPEEKRVTLEMYKSGLISRESAMVILGCDDPDEEITRMESEVKVTTPVEKAQIITALSKTGWQLSLDQMPEVDSDILGLTPRDIEAYKQQLDEEAARQSLTGGNAGAKGGSPGGSTNQPGVQSPGSSVSGTEPGSTQNQ